MVLDPKLRDVLDFLPCEPCLERPSPDQEVLCSICHRLNRTVALKCQVSLVGGLPAPSEAELEAARAEARLKQAEFEALRAHQEADDETLTALQRERDELLARQRELEERLATLEASSHGGQITFVDDAPVDEVVEFTRVDLHPRSQDDEIMEFESMGSESSAFAAPEEGAWEDSGWEETGGWEENSAPETWQEDETSWEEATATHPADGSETVAWDDDAESPSYGEDEEAPWETVDTPADWAGQGAEEEGRAHADTAATDDPYADLDEKTRADLSELEAQLEELERELAKKKTVAEDDDA